MRKAARNANGAMALWMLVALAAISCGDIDALRNRLEPATPHERYAESLRNAGLDSTALGHDWLLASQIALGEATPVSLPFRAEDAFPGDSTTALGYRLELRRGQRLRVAVTVDTTRAMLLFVDLFMAPRDSTEGPRHIESAEPRARSLDVEARRDGSYLLRVQPELLRGGEYTLTVSTEPSLAFPVAGRDGGAIRSYFGAARDAGRRVHHGIDIFAPRGTPVLSVSDGFVRDAGTNTLGGKVVWVWDDRRGHSYYYAHLDSQAVTFGARVQPGDTLGFVGNTGNARTTAPHLHFGIYTRGEGPVDPLPFVHQLRSQRATATAEGTADLRG
ncbi:MAG: M23 family metallopeptidase [Gemmatimonadaceae bacterium]